MPTVAILVLEQLPCFPDKLVPVQLQTSGLKLGCLFVGLGVRCHVCPFRVPQLWSSCLNSHVAPHQQEPFDEHCFAISSFLVTLFVAGATGIALSFTQPFAVFEV